jgi:hypothetical protein
MKGKEKKKENAHPSLEEETRDPSGGVDQDENV